MKLTGCIVHHGKDQWSVDGLIFTCSALANGYICKDLRRAAASRKPATVVVREDGILLGVNINDAW